VLPWPCRGPKGMPTCPHKHAKALTACLGLGCLPMGAAMALARPWQHACKHALALAACPWGVALALAACLGLGCLPMGPCPGLGCLPMGAALAAACPGLGSMPACTPRRIAPHRPALQQNWLVPFSIFVFLNSVHDFRGGFQQAVRRSERFRIFYDFPYFSASENHKK